jgi:hypothetical protein
MEKMTSKWAAMIQQHNITNDSKIISKYKVQLASHYLSIVAMTDSMQNEKTLE